VPDAPGVDLFGRTGRHWLSRQELPADERMTVKALLRQLDFHGDELAVVDKDLAAQALTDPVVARLMTVPGVDAIAGISILAAAGDFSRFDDPDKVGGLCRAQPAGAAVRELRARARPDQRDRRGPRPRGSGRGGLVGQPGAGTVAGLLAASQSATRLPKRP
jgi:transposase